MQSGGGRQPHRGGGRGAGRGSGPVTCYNCQQTGHLSRDCRQNAGGGAGQGSGRPGGQGGGSAGGYSQQQSRPMKNTSQSYQGQSGGGNQPQRQGGGYGGSGGVVHHIDKKEVDLKTIGVQTKYGWHQLPENAKNIALPSKQNSSGSLHEACSNPRSKVITNHFPMKTNLPQTIFHYTVTASREGAGAKPPKAKGKPRLGDPPPRAAILPKDIMCPLLRIACRMLTRAYEEETGANDIGIITDFVNTIFSTQELEGLVALELHISAAQAGIDGDGIFILLLVRGDGDVDTTIIQEISDGRFEGEMDANVDEACNRVKQVLSLLMKNTGNENYNPTAKKNALMKIPTLQEEDNRSLGGGLTIWSGLSLTPVYGWKPYLNVDIDNSAFVKGKAVFDLLIELFPRKDIGNVSRWSADIPKATAFLKGCKVRWDARKIDGGVVSGSKAVFSVERRGVSQCMFDFNGRNTSVFDYYGMTYRNVLKFRDGPCLRLGSDTGPMVPAELCVVKQGKSINRKLTGDQTSQMITHARKNPGELKWEIESGIEELALHRNDLLAKFGVEVTTEMLTVRNARVLDPPKLIYGESERQAGKWAVVTPNDGKWDIGRQNESIQFYDPVKIDSWAILVLDWDRGPEKNQLRMFVDMLKRQAVVRGMTLPEPTTLDYIDGLHRDVPENHSANFKILEESFSKVKREWGSENNKKRFLMVVIPKKGSPLYNVAKQVSELYTSILTQCVTTNSVKPRPRKDRPEQSVVDNILLKINAKVGGVNHLIQHLKDPNFLAVDILKYPVLIMGIDVNHSPAGLDARVGISPSYAAVTGTVDRSGMVHMMYVQAQEKANAGAAEVIRNLDEITERMLRRFRAVTTQAPQKILVFRDGVGDGQFNEVLDVEMRAIRRACAKLSESYKPQITFITVQKRHKTRLMNQDGSGRIDNVQPGTVVDTDIVKPSQTEFYLQSHAVIQGTGRPTHYHLLWDDSDFTVDQLQVLTYYLCYAYCRCNRSVKIPAPTYYAHWAAYRAKVLAEGMHFETIQDVNDYIQQRDAPIQGGPSFSQQYPFHFV